MLKPTVGRVLHYYASEGEGLPMGVPHAAIVASVRGEDRVSLAVFDDCGRPLGRQNVRLVESVLQVPCCCWPPVKQEVAREVGITYDKSAIETTAPVTPDATKAETHEAAATETTSV